MGRLDYIIVTSLISMRLLVPAAAGLAPAATQGTSAALPVGTSGPHWPRHMRSARRRIQTSPAHMSPRPVAVYSGSHLIASGLSLSAAVRRTHAQAPFAIKVPRFVPPGYVPVQLAITPRRRGVSAGLSTLTYVHGGPGRIALNTANGFQIDQAARAIPFVGGVQGHAVQVGAFTATVHEFRGPGTDIIVLTWVDAQGHGYSLLTPAQWSHLSMHAMTQIAASLR